MEVPSGRLNGCSATIHPIQLSSKIMVQHIQLAMFYKVHTGEPHDLADLGSILSVIARSLTFLTHRFWIVRTLEPHGQTIG